MEEQLSQPRGPRKHLGKRKPQRGGKGKKMARVPRDMRTATKVQDNKKTRRLIRKRIREYNSDDEGEEGKKQKGTEEDPSDDDEESESEGDDNRLEGRDAEGSSEDDVAGMQHEITKFAEGSRAFKNAFTKIMNKSVSTTDPLGPILSAHKKLVAEKLAEELDEQKVKAEARKEKRLLGEKGHVQPANYLDTKEKFLISVATKGVVKLFNAVNKAQQSQRGLNPTKTKEARELAKRRRKAFISALRKPTTQANEDENKDEPTWAPLRDNYMLTDSKFKNWDKMENQHMDSQPQKTPLESSDEE